MNQQSLSSFLWSVADLLRGDCKQSEYGKVILPFTVLRRLDWSENLRQQAANNTKEQFATSPDLRTELMNAILDALEAHKTMSSQAIGSEKVQEGLKENLLEGGGGRGG